MGGVQIKTHAQTQTYAHTHIHIHTTIHDTYGGVLIHMVVCYKSIRIHARVRTYTNIYTYIFTYTLYVCLLCLMCAPFWREQGLQFFSS